MRTLVVVKGGEISMDVIEGQGKACVKATEAYVQQLSAGTVPTQRFKPEFDDSGDGRGRELAHE